MKMELTTQSQTFLVTAELYVDDAYVYTRVQVFGGPSVNDTYQGIMIWGWHLHLHY